MVTTYFNPTDVECVCSLMRRHNEEPIIYTSMSNANQLMIAEIRNNEFSPQLGMAGKYKGIPIYVTDTVGDLWVIVPKYKEN